MQTLENRSAGFSSENYNFENGSMTYTLKQLKSETKTESSKLILFYKGSICSDDRNQHPLTHMLGLIFISMASSLKLPGTGMHSMHLLYPLLKCLRIASPV